MNLSVDTHQMTAWLRSQRATSRCTAGSARRHRSGRGGKRVAWATPFWVTMALPEFQAEQKAQGQHHRDRMAVKTRPQPDLILIPAQLLLGLLMELLDGMPAMGSMYQLLQRGRGWQVTPIVLVFVRLPTGGSLPQQPADVGLTLRRDPPAPHGHELFAQPSLGPVPPAHRAPLAPGQRGQDLVDPLARGHTPPLRAHVEVAADRHHVAFAPPLQARQEMGVVAIVRICHHATDYGDNPHFLAG